MHVSPRVSLYAHYQSWTTLLWLSAELQLGCDSEASDSLICFIQAISLCSGVIDVPFEYKCLRETFSDIKKLRAVSRRPGSLQLATAACNLTKQQLKRVVSNLKKSSQAAHSWYETKTHSQGSAPAPAISGAWLSCADLVQNTSCLSAEAHWGKKCTNFLS